MRTQPEPVIQSSVVGQAKRVAGAARMAPAKVKDLRNVNLEPLSISKVPVTGFVCRRMMMD